MGAFTHSVLPGGLSEQDHDRIHELAERGWKPSRIARQINKNPGTVYWFMLRQGLVAPKPAHNREPYERNGRMVYPYSPEEDAYIEALRVQDFAFRDIANLASKRFGKARTAHGIFVRLTMLAAREIA